MMPLTVAVGTHGRLARRAERLAWFTIAWNTIEGIVAVGAGLSAGSVALVGFGLDSGVEVFAGAVVVWQLHGLAEDREQRALRLIGLSFFALAFYIVAETAHQVLVGDGAGTSAVGMTLALASLLIMPVLAAAKRRTGRRLGNRVVVADSTETALCSSMSAILLAGLVLNATIGWWWADPVAASAIAVLAVREGNAAWRGVTCCDAC
jgi:divalent metal cation (Fe/Co/Zn/Cd) transporter